MTKRSVVSIIGCEDYDPCRVSSVLVEHLENLGGIGGFVSRGDNVIIKPNLICPKPIEQPAQTNPVIIVELAKLLLDCGAKVTVADSPAWADSIACIAAMGIDGQLARLGVQVRDLNKPKLVDIPFAGCRAGISSLILEADKVFNLPKLKAHQQMRATIAVKNMFGAVTGKRKALWHYRKGGSHQDFAAFLFGIYKRTSPVVNIVDGIVAMEGQGPINGVARQIGVTLASRDAIACEVVCAEMLGIHPCDLPIVKAAVDLKMSSGDIGELDLVGDDYSKFVCSDFVHAVASPLRFGLPQIMKSISKQLVIKLKAAFNRGHF